MYNMTQYEYCPIFYCHTKQLIKIYILHKALILLNFKNDDMVYLPPKILT